MGELGASGDILLFWGCVCGVWLGGGVVWCGGVVFGGGAVCVQSEVVVH